MSRRRGITLIVTGIYRRNYSINNSVSKNVTSQYNLSFLNPIVIPFIIPLVYIKKYFPSAYLWMYFTVRLILLVMSSIKVTRHHNVWFFFFFHFLFSHCSSLGIYRENFSIDIYRWIQDWKIILVKVIVIYWQKNSVYFSVYIY
jgi:hypothetical protein